MTTGCPIRRSRARRARSAVAGSAGRFSRSTIGNPAPGSPRRGRETNLRAALRRPVRSPELDPPALRRSTSGCVAPPEHQLPRLAPRNARSHQATGASCSQGTERERRASRAPRGPVGQRTDRPAARARFPTETRRGRPADRRLFAGTAPPSSPVDNCQSSNECAPELNLIERLVPRAVPIT
jgi:hypothetical protein